MKKLILMLALIFTMFSCGAQELQTEPLDRGHAVAVVVESIQTGFVMNAGGRSLIVNGGELEQGMEYDIIYDIIERKEGGILVVNFVAAEPSERQSDRDRAKLLQLLKRK